jgi:hypothetical protein
MDGGCPKSNHTGIHDVPVHIRGRYDRLGPLVPRRFPVVLAGTEQPAMPKEQSGRLELARWIASPANPLTARVIVNRVWQHHFGEALVRTPSNFGKLGEPPTHPDLLDWLADEFIRQGWSLKKLHRLVLLSAAYQQDSRGSADAVRHDPDNRLLGRMHRRRLDAEALRDSLLATAGQLEETRGGPAVRDLAAPRRTLYLMTVRSDRSSFRELFDAADPTAVVDRRVESTVAPQALFLVNHPFVRDQARLLAERVCRDVADERGRIERLHLLVFGRPPRAAEVRLAEDTLRDAADPAAGWVAYAHLLVCANEFLFVD